MEIKATAPQRRPLGAYTVAQAAELLGVSASYLYEEIHAGRLQALRRRGNVRGYRVMESALREWMASEWEPVR